MPAFLTTPFPSPPSACVPALATREFLSDSLLHVLYRRGGQLRPEPAGRPAEGSPDAGTVR